MKKRFMLITGFIMLVFLAACATGSAAPMVGVPTLDSIEAYEAWIETLDWDIELSFIDEEGDVLHRNDALSREIKKPEVTGINAEMNELVLIMATVAFDFSIERITDAQVTEIENASLVNYQEIHRGAGSGMNLHFEFNRVVENFTFITVDFVDNEGYSYVKTGVLAEVGTLGPDQSLILTHYLGVGTTAISGFTFTDPDGVDVWYALLESQKDGSFYAIPFDWSHENDLYVSDNDQPTVNDESGNTVPPTPTPPAVPSTPIPPATPIPPVNPPQNATYHIVVAGETLTSIARLHETTIAALQQMNNMGTTTDIIVGQRLSLVASSNKTPSPSPEELVLTITDGNTPGSIVVSSNQNLTNVSINRIYAEVVDDGAGWYWHVQGVLRNLNDLKANSERLIEDFVFAGATFFAEALTFTDASGNTRHFAFNQNQAYPVQGDMFNVREFTPGMELNE